jgi:hypothetical protein
MIVRRSPKGRLQIRLRETRDVVYFRSAELTETQYIGPRIGARWQATYDQTHLSGESSENYLLPLHRSGDQ